MRSWSHTPWLDDPSQSTVETVVIGGGQAGLAMSWFPGQAGRDHVVDERRTGVGGGWQDRWDGFRLVTAELETVASPVESLVPVVRAYMVVVIGLMSSPRVGDRRPTPRHARRGPGRH